MIVFNRFKVWTRLIFSAVVPLLALLVMSFSATSIFSSINTSVDSIYKDRVVPLQTLKEIADSYAVLVIDAVNKANAGRVDAKAALTDIKKAQNLVKTRWNAYMQTELTAEESRLANEAEQLFGPANDSIVRLEAKLVTMQGNIQGQLNEFDGPLYDAIDPISHQLTELIDLQLRVAKSERDNIEAYTSDTTSIYLLATAGVVLAVITFNFLLAKSINGPLNKLREVMEHIQDSSDLTCKIDIHSQDEIGMVAEAFNKMLDRIHAAMLEVQHASHTLKLSAQELINNVEVTNQGLQRQAQDTDMVATATTEMSATVAELASNTTDAQSAAQMASNLAEQGLSLADQNKHLNDSLIEAIGRVADQVKQLEQESQAIGSVVDVINGIADQTNLLALNAAIEAARAGDQGRGFAVVADEVRTLAQRTQNSTQEIRDAVERLQKGAHNSVMVMTNGQKKAYECSEGILRGQASLVSIVESVQNILQMNIQIAAALEEQNQVTEDINRNVVSIREVSVDSSASGSLVNKCGEQLNHLASVLLSQINKFKISAG